jgi:hypothetical protein
VHRGKKAHLPIRQNRRTVVFFHSDQTVSPALEKFRFPRLSHFPRFTLHVSRFAVCHPFGPFAPFSGKTPLGFTSEKQRSLAVKFFSRLMQFSSIYF